MKYIKLILSVVYLLLSNMVFSQVTILSDVDSDELVCPGDIVNYSLSLPSGTSFCSATWQLSDGSGNFLVGGNVGQQVAVIWDDQKPNKVEIEAAVEYRTSGSSCSSSTSETIKFSNILRAVFQETVPNVGSTVNVPYCAGARPTVTLSAGPMYIKKTGGIGEPQLTEVELWDWDLPNGWRQKGTSNTGQFFSESRVIEIEPINSGGKCSSGGTVKVRAIAGGVNNCDGSIVSVSKWSNITLSRLPNPSSLQVSAPSNFTTTSCGNNTPVTFTTTSVSCATNYTWTYPSGWTQVSKINNKITLRPSGGNGDVGDIKAKAVLACGTLNAKPYTVQFKTPVISAPSIICTSGNSISLLNVGNGTNTNWTVSNNLKIILGQGTPTATVAAKNNYSTGLGFINAGVSCAGVNINQKAVWVGKPGISSAQINSPGTLNWLASYTFNVTGDQFANSFEWVIPSGWQILAFGSKRSVTITPTSTGVHNIYVRAYNNCGFAYLQSIQVCVKGNGYVCGGGGGPGGPTPYIVINPNPVTDNLNITFANLEEIEKYFGNVKKSFQVDIVDLNGESCVKGSLNKNGLHLNVKHLEPGIYVVNVFDKENNYQYRLLKE